jgi:GT2 family glycosyltransferase
MASHNRRRLTSLALQALKAQADACSIHVYLVDDGSSDGTQETARQIIGSHLTVIEGTGEWFWAKSMAVAEQAALRDGGFDYLLWLNDDTFLDKDALDRLLTTSMEVGDSCIIVGSVRHPETGTIIYGGINVEGPRFLRQSLQKSPKGTHTIDTFQGNVVLIPRQVQLIVGAIDGEYEHAFADIDYGLRARSSGVSLLCISPPLAEGTVNSSQESLYGGLGRRKHLNSVLSRKNLPLSSTVRFAKRHGGILWPAYLGWIYLRTFMGKNLFRKWNS